jgi:anti-sigma factor RsiW
MNRDKEKIKDLILTDYLDDQLPAEQKKEIDKAIAQDPELQDFLKMAQESLQKPFEKAPVLETPEYLWRDIKAVIEEEKNQPSPLNALVDAVRRTFDWLFAIPKPAMALAAIVLLFSVSIPTKNLIQRHLTHQQEIKRIEYLAFLAEGLQNVDEERGDLGTSIEEYFL